MLYRLCNHNIVYAVLLVWRHRSEDGQMSDISTMAILGIEIAERYCIQALQCLHTVEILGLELMSFQKEQRRSMGYKQRSKRNVCGEKRNNSAERDPRVHLRGR